MLKIGRPGNSIAKTQAQILEGRDSGFMGPLGRSHYNLGERIFGLVGCSGVLVPVGIKVRAKTQPNP